MTQREALAGAVEMLQEISRGKIYDGQTYMQRLVAYEKVLHDDLSQPIEWSK